MILRQRTTPTGRLTQDRFWFWQVIDPPHISLTSLHRHMIMYQI